MPTPFLSPFFDPSSLEVAARHFAFLPGPDGVIPWLSGRRLFFPTLELAGHPYADYRSVPDPRLLEVLWDLHGESASRRLFEFGCIAEGDPSETLIAGWTERHGLIMTAVPQPRAPFLDITGSWQAYREAKRAKSWKNMARARRLLEERGGPLTLALASRPEDLGAALPSCLALYDANWSPLTSSSMFLSRAGKDFLRDLLSTLSREGKAELATLTQGTTLLAFSAGLMLGGTYFFYIFATNKAPEYGTYSVGKLLISGLLESAFARGFKRFDFMAGEESYKYEWTKQSRSRTTYYAAQDTPWGRFALSTLPALLGGLSLAKRQRWIRGVLSAAGKGLLRR